MAKVVVAGAGVFGTSVSERLAWNTDNEVWIHTIEGDVCVDINQNHRNTKYFPTRFLNQSIRASMDYEVFADADVVLLVIPSKVIVPFANEMRKHIKKGSGPLIINLAKGMSDEGAFLTEKIPFTRTASMKGPTFAIETLNGFPTAFTFGGRREDYKWFKHTILPGTGFSLDYSPDVRAVELLSILKNMYAIAIGLVSGRYNSPNVDFLVYTKAVNEMRRLLKHYECDPETIFRYCGIGDLGLTSLNDLSRNRTFGMLIGKGFKYDEDQGATVIEGKRTIKLIGEQAKEWEESDEDFPLVTALYKLMYEGSSLQDYIVSALS